MQCDERNRRHHRSDSTPARTHPRRVSRSVGHAAESEQVQRLCGLDRTTCQMVLDALVDAKSLRVTPDGAYTRLVDGEVPRPRPAKADLMPNVREGS